MPGLVSFPSPPWLSIFSKEFRLQTVRRRQDCWWQCVTETVPKNRMNIHKRIRTGFWTYKKQQKRSTQDSFLDWRGGKKTGEPAEKRRKEEKTRENERTQERREQEKKNREKKGTTGENTEKLGR